MKKIIVIETSDIGALYTARAAQLLGYEALFLTNLNNYQSDTRNQLLECQYIDCDTTSAESLLQTLKNHKVDEIAGVITFLDSRLTIATELAQKLEVKGLDRSILELKDKAYVQKLIPHFSPPTVIFSLNEFPYTEIEQLMARFKKIIIKPTLTAGALGVHILDCVEDLKEIKTRLSFANLPEFLNNGTWVAQAYLDGPLYSIEGYVRNGSVNILGISDRLKIGKTESQISFPVDYKLPEALKVSISNGLTGIFLDC